MRSLLRPGCPHGLVGRWLWMILFFASALSSVGVSAQTLPPLISLSGPSVQVQAEGLEWLDTTGKATINAVSAASSVAGGLFTPFQASAMRRLKPDEALWLKLRVLEAQTTTAIGHQGDHDVTHHWILELPLAFLDEVTLYQLRSDGTWMAQEAGDTVAVNRWPEPGRHPFFRVTLPHDSEKLFYLRIRHQTPAVIPLRFVNEARHTSEVQLDYLFLGAACGALILLIAATLVQAWLYKDRAYALYALYSSLMMLAVAAYGGLAAQLLWPGSGWLADRAQGVLAILAVGASVLFVRSIAALDLRVPWLDRVMVGVSYASPLAVVVFLSLPKPLGALLVAAYFAAGLLVVPTVGALVKFRGDRVGLWLLLAYVPLGVSVLMLLVRLLGISNTAWFDQYGFVASMAIQVPLLLVALNIRSRERHVSEARSQALSSQDALTGLLTSILFHDRLRQLIARCKRDKESAAVVFIDLVNYQRIKQLHGTPVAEQSVLRSVIKLRRILRDVDTLSRIDEARFGLVLEGTRSRQAITERASRLIAAGLMPLPGLKPEVILQFHVAAAFLHDRVMTAEGLYKELGALLGSMSPRTRRPIRFLEPVDTLHMPMSTDSLTSDAQDSSLPKPMRAGVHSQRAQL